MKFPIKNIAIVIGVFIVGVYVGFFYFTSHRLAEIQPIFNGKNIRNKTAMSRFTNPLLECSDIDSLSNSDVQRVKDEVAEYINNEKKKQSVLEVSVYFRDLNNGPWFGINEKTQFVPGSLLKVPLMLSVYKSAMENPLLLKKSVPYNGSNDFGQYYKPIKSVISGKMYTVEELLDLMIIYSDNDAAETLFKLFNNQTLEESYHDLGIDPPKNNEFTMQVKTYASFFRVLYNATYLNQEYSEKALQLLASAVFDRGITAKLPKSLVVAHKFGERGVGTEVKQLHDCGIVYYPQQPYILCVMSKGPNFEELEKISANVSSIIYEDLNSNNNSQ